MISENRSSSVIFCSVSRARSSGVVAVVMDTSPNASPQQQPGQVTSLRPIDLTDYTIGSAWPVSLPGCEPRWSPQQHALIYNRG
jgi:hypothetical protein